MYEKDLPGMVKDLVIHVFFFFHMQLVFAEFCQSTTMRRCQSRPKNHRKVGIPQKMTCRMVETPKKLCIRL